MNSPMTPLLLVEDEPLLRQRAAERLRAAGYAVEEAEDGTSGLAKASSTSFDIVITDLIMPRMDGLELLTHLQELPHAPEVIVCTSAGTVENAVAALKLGAFDFVVKPYEPDELLIKIKKALERRRLTSENERLSQENAYLKQIESLTQELQTSNDSLKRRVSELSTIHHISLLLNSALNEQELLKRLLDFIGRSLQVQSAALLLAQGSGELVCRVSAGAFSREWGLYRTQTEAGMFGDVKMFGEPLVINDPTADARYERSLADQLHTSIHSLLAVPLKAKQTSLGVLVLINKQGHSPRFTQDEITLITTVAREGSLAIENFGLKDKLREAVRLDEELKVARRIQEDLYPKTLPSLSGWAWTAKGVPARTVGGDFYWASPARNGTVDLVIGDVSGKGIPAALYMAKLVAILEAEARPEKSPGDILEAINRRLLEHQTSNMFASMVYLRAFSSPALDLQWATAGHPPPLLLSSEAKTPLALEEGDRAVGLTKQSTYRTRTLTLHPYDQLLLYTDGFFEATAPSGDRFGLARLQEAFHQVHTRTPEELVEELIKISETFTGGEIQDDLTLLVLRRIPD